MIGHHVHAEAPSTSERTVLTVSNLKKKKSINPYFTFYRLFVPVPVYGVEMDKIYQNCMHVSDVGAELLVANEEMSLLWSYTNSGSHIFGWYPLFFALGNWQLHSLGFSHIY
jgi:hypothetical protein